MLESKKPRKYRDYVESVSPARYIKPQHGTMPEEVKLKADFGRFTDDVNSDSNQLLEEAKERKVGLAVQVGKVLLIVWKTQIALSL